MPASVPPRGAESLLQDTSAAGADGADEAVDLTAGLLEDLARRRGDMGVAVDGIVELVGPDRAVRLALGEFGGEPPGELHVVVGVLVRDGRDLDQLGTEQAQRVLLFLALRLRNDDHGAIAERLGNQRQADAGIAGRSLDDDTAGAQEAAPLGVADDEQRRAILVRLAGIEALRLAEDGAAGRLGRALQPDERRVADCLENGWMECHRICLLFARRLSGDFSGHKRSKARKRFSSFRWLEENHA